MLIHLVIDGDDDVIVLQPVIAALTIDPSEIQGCRTLIMSVDDLLKQPNKIVEAVHNALADEPLTAGEWDELRARTRLYLESLEPTQETDNG